MDSPSAFVQYHELSDIFRQPFLKTFSFSQERERIVSGAMSKRGQKTNREEGSPMAKARPHQSGDAQSVQRKVQRRNLVTKFGISVQSVE